MEESYKSSAITTSEDPENKSVIVAVVPFFQEIGQLKKLLNNLQSDINTLVGRDTTIMVSSRRGRSIGSLMVKNSQLCESGKSHLNTQKCNSMNCKTCPLICDVGEVITVNGKRVISPSGHTCKSRNVIYIAKCNLCSDLQNNTYVGQTNQPFHKRVNGHRSNFKENDLDAVEKSALSLHALEHHNENFNINNFRLMIYKRVSPKDLNRTEAKTIGSLRTGVLGLNRMNIQKS